VTLTLHARRLDAAVAEQARAWLRAAVPGDGTPVTVDMREVEFIDSSGLGALISLRRHLGEGRALTLANPSRFVAKVLRLTRLDRALPVEG
jgi:anti-sigma B factor antagonist